LGRVPTHDCRDPFRARHNANSHPQRKLAAIKSVLKVIDAVVVDRGYVWVAGFGNGADRGDDRSPWQ
jgi:hypothetical protein